MFKVGDVVKCVSQRYGVDVKNKIGIVQKISNSVVTEYWVSFGERCDLLFKGEELSIPDTLGFKDWAKVKGILSECNIANNFDTGGVIKNKSKYVLGSPTMFEIRLGDDSKMALLPKCKKVIVKPEDEMIIVLWMDGTKTIVKCCEDDNFDVDNGIARAYIKKIYGTNGKFRKQYKDLIDIHY